MKMSILNIIILFPLAFIIGCSENKKTDISHPVTVNENVNLPHIVNKSSYIPKDWKKIEQCGLSFYAPTNLKEVKVQPIDSCVKEYRSKDILFSLDLFPGGGQESDTRRNEYSSKKDFQITETKIDGRKSEIITYYEPNNSKLRTDLHYGAVLYVPVITENGDNLTIWTYNRSAEDRETTKKIFETIRFGK